MYCSGYDPMAGSCECGNECSVFMKAGYFLAKWATVSIKIRTVPHRVSYLITVYVTITSISQTSSTVSTLFPSVNNWYSITH